MGIDAEKLGHIRDYVRRLQNPYAILSLTDCDDEPASDHAVTSEQRRVYYRRLQNPHAFDSVFNSEDGSTDIAVPEIRCAESIKCHHKTASRKEFERECRRIFNQYIPANEARILRRHHRDFILRNSTRSAEQRAGILREIYRYDISQAGDFHIHFNREREVFTAAKLRKIEQPGLGEAP